MVFLALIRNIAKVQVKQGGNPRTDVQQKRGCIGRGYS